ncbi:copper chaperone PCu(A)C [Aestuariivirga sp.]|uniref:copper chaperone PCu(A)C n=1 Tax=Aestuariivirga sp. TaxID=2650926 RepID=UPI0039E32442
MRKLILELITATALTLAAILTTVADARANDVIVSEAFARASATPTAETGVIYVTIANTGSVADQLTGVATDAAQMAHLHNSEMKDGVASMTPVASLAIAPGETVVMKPGGLHIMLMGLKAPLKKGGHIGLDLTFAKAGTIHADVPVGGVGAMTP